ncbi:hypothetical protein [Rhodococcus opacus]|uniref:hypothetical protein n=1 Tax=Rhodococcus opacus TaxID=37919 RepID=UPI00217D1683|nr:hypothetical protein [Rhodococcus opacus]
MDGQGFLEVLIAYAGVSATMLAVADRVRKERRRPAEGGDGVTGGAGRAWCGPLPVAATPTPAPVRPYPPTSPRTTPAVIDFLLGDFGLVVDVP